MSLFLSSLLTGILFLAVGLWFFRMDERRRGLTLALLRNDSLAALLMTVGSAWFLWKVLHLGEADFGAYRHWLFLAFLGVAVGSWFLVRDFLAVRGACILALLASGVFLDSAFGLYELPQRLVLVTACYLMITAAVYYGWSPYRTRDHLQFLAGKRPVLGKALGALLSVWGLALLGTTVTYL